MTQPHLLLVDASGFAYRAFHSGNPVHREKDGEPIGAALRFMGLLWRLRGAARADEPTHGAACFDAPGKTFRHKLDPNYKGNRSPARNLELAGQFPLMHHAAETLGMRPLEAPGYEADDLIATLATRAKKAGMRTTIVSSDKDMGQLVEDGVIEIYDPRPAKRLQAPDIEAKMGVPPKMVPHVQALWGDAVDNIIGVDGIGRDKAGALVRRYGGVEKVIAAAKDIRWAPIRLQMVKKAVQARVRLNLKLATLRRDIPLDVEPSSLVLEPIMKSHLKEMLRVLGAPHYMEALFALDPQMARAVPAVNPKEAFAWHTEELVHPGQRLPQEPQCGFYMRKLVRGGPFVQAAIWREPEIDPMTGQPTGLEVLRCTVGGAVRDPLAEWPRLSMTPIKQSAYEYEGAAAAYAKKWQPDSPRANPTKPIVLTAQPASRNPRRKSHV